MKIVIAAVSSSGQLSGVQRHAVNLASCLLKRAEVSQIHFVVAPWQWESIRGTLPQIDARLTVHIVTLMNKGLSRNYWYYQQLPELAHEVNADLVHLTYPMLVRRKGFKCPVVVTLHDCYPYDVPENFGFPKVVFNRIVLSQCLRSVSAIACVSNSTLSRLAALFSMPILTKAVVVYNTVNPLAEYTGRAAAPWWGSKPFLLCVAQHRYNKNILLILQAFERLLKDGTLSSEIRMVVIGIEGPETQRIKRFIAKANLSDRVILLNGITEDQLQWSYANCLLVAAPSSIEGFGLPVAEALQVGCRIVCSDIAAFREFGDVHCRFVALGNGGLRNLADAIYDVLSKPVPPPVYLPQLSPNDIADQYVKLYSSLLLRAQKDSSGELSASMEPRPEMR
jgi:glycosyltransferase involved in cell wall biosynthesis